MLERDLEDLPVGEEFVQAVMDNLPQEPPPRQRKRHGHRGLRLAGFAGILGAGALIASRIIALGGSGGARFSSPALDLESAPGTLEGLLGLLRTALIALEAVARFPFDAGLSLSGGLALLPVVTAVAMICMAACSGFLALAARTLARAPR